MPALTPTERNYQRNGHPHKATFYLSVYVPPIVYCGQITGSPARGAYQLTLTNVSGSIANVETGQTVFIGTSCGDDSVSRRRLRSRSGQVLTLDENSVEWVNGQYVTVYQNWEMWSIYPYIEPEAPYTFYKDRDVAFAGQKPNPVAIAGLHRVGFLSGSKVFSLNASASYAMAVGATITGYSWSCTGGSVASPTSATTTLTFSGAVHGTYVLRLTVTDSNGATHTTRRMVFLHEREGANAPYADFELTSPVSGDNRSGGYRTQFRVRGDASINQFPDGALVLLWYESHYAGQEVYIGGHGNILFAGYIRNETVVKEATTNYVTFEATTIESLMSRHLMFSLSIEDNDDPSTWYHLTQLTTARALHYLLDLHSTLLSLTDVFLPTGNTSRLPACDDFVKSDLYGMANSFASRYSIFASLVCNKVGQMYIEVDINMLDDAARAVKPIVMAIEEDDWRAQPGIEVVRRVEDSVGLAVVSGLFYDGTDKTPLISKAPGEVPNAIGAAEVNEERQVLASQDECNMLAGRALAVANNPFEVRVPFAGNYSCLDIVPQEWLTLTLEAGDTNRGLVFNAKKMVCRTIQISIDTAAGTIQTDCVFDPEATGDDGIPGNWPIDTLPTPPPAPVPAPSFPQQLFAFDVVNGCRRSNIGSGVWSARNGGLTGTNIQDRHGGKDPWWMVKQGSLNPANVILWKCDIGKLYRSVDAGGTWVNETPGTNPPNDAGDSPAPTASTVDYVYYEGNPYVEDQHVFLVRWQNDDDEWRSWLLLTDDDGVTWTWQSLATGSGLDCDDVETAVAYNADVMGGSTTGNYVPIKRFVAALSADKFVLVWADVTDGRIGKAKVGTVAGAGITFGAEAIFHNASTKWPSVVALTSSKIVVAYTDGDSIGSVVVGDIVGTTITFATADAEQFYLTPPDTPDMVVVLRLSTTKIVIVFGVASSTVSADGWAVAATINDTEFTFGTAVEFEAGNFFRIDAIALSDQLFVVCYFYGGSDDTRLIVGSVDVGSSTVMSFGTPHTTGLNVQRHSLARLTDSIFAYVTTEDAATWADLNGRRVITSGTSITFVGAAGTFESDVDISEVVACQVSGVNFIVAYSKAGTGDELTYCHAQLVASSIVPSTPQDCGSNVVAGRDFIGLTVLGESTPLIAFSVASNHINTVVTAGGGGYEVKVIWASISKTTGDFMYVTLWDGSALYMYRFTLADLSVDSFTSLGAASTAELAANVAAAFPYSRNDDTVYVYGRMQDPMGMGNPVHILRTEDGMESFEVVEDEWEGDYCGSLIVYNGRVYAIRNKTGGGGQLYRGISTMLYKSNLAFQVNPGSFMAHVNGPLFAGAKAVVSSRMVMRALPTSYNTWSNFTGDYPTTGSIVALLKA